MPPGAATPQSAWPEPRPALRCSALTSPSVALRAALGGSSETHLGWGRWPWVPVQSRAEVEVRGLRSVRPKVHATQNHRPRVRALGVNIQPQAALGLGSTACVCSPPRTSLGLPNFCSVFCGVLTSVPVFSGGLTSLAYFRR